MLSQTNPSHKSPEQSYPTWGESWEMERNTMSGWFLAGTSTRLVGHAPRIRSRSRPGPDIRACTFSRLLQ